MIHTRSGWRTHILPSHSAAAIITAEKKKSKIEERPSDTITNQQTTHTKKTRAFSHIDTHFMRAGSLRERARQFARAPKTTQTSSTRCERARVRPPVVRTAPPVVARPHRGSPLAALHTHTHKHTRLVNLKPFCSACRKCLIRYG